MVGRPRKSAAPIVGVEPANAGVVGGTGTDDSGFVTIDPAELTGSAGSVGDSPGTADAPKRRGRKPGTGSARSKGAALDVNAVQALLYSLHTMAAGMLRVPQLQLDPAEAKAMAEAAASVSRHYNLEVAAKTMDWMNLVGVLGMIYVPRVIAISQTAKTNRAPRQARTNAETIQPEEPAMTTGGIDIPGVGTYDPSTGGVRKPN